MKVVKCGNEICTGTFLGTEMGDIFGNSLQINGIWEVFHAAALLVAVETFELGSIAI